MQFLFGVIHKKVGPLQIRNAEFKILKTAWSIAQRALRESFFFFLPKIFLLCWKNERILHQLNAGAEEWMEITLREDLDPDIEFYYHYQFKIYHEAYLIWDRDTWETVLTTCTVYRIEVHGKLCRRCPIGGQGKGHKVHC